MNPPRGTCSGRLLRETKCQPWTPWGVCWLVGEGGRNMSGVPLPGLTKHTLSRDQSAEESTLWCEPNNSV